MKDKPHILIIRFSSLGDVVIQSSFIRWLKFICPGSKISFLVAKEFAALVENLSEVDHVWTYNRSSGISDLKQLRSISKKINQESVDLVFDLHNNSRTLLLSWFSSIPFIRADKRSLKRKLLVKFKWNFLKNLSSQHQRTIEDFGFLSHSPINLEKLERGSETLDASAMTKINQTASLAENLIVLSPVASFSSKRWPISYYGKLLELIMSDDELSHYKVVIIAGPNDDYCQSLKYDNDRFSNLQGRTSLKETIEYFSRAKLCVTNDTGSLHMAESFGVPSIAIFGSTSPWFGFRPHLKGSAFFYADAACSPCSTTGNINCSQPSHVCMLDIKPASVYIRVKEILLGDLLSV